MSEEILFSSKDFEGDSIAVLTYKDGIVIEEEGASKEDYVTLFLGKEQAIELAKSILNYYNEEQK